MERLAGRLLRSSIAVGVLLIATLACYTPRQIQAEKEAISQFALLEESIYVPPDATLLAENHGSGHSHDYVSAGAQWIYTVPRPCEEIVAEYRDAMVDSGWTATSLGGCDQLIWLYMHTPGAQFSIMADLPEQDETAPLWEEWKTLQKQYQGLYYVTSNLAVGYDEP